MSDEYDNWRKYEDAKAFKNKLAEIDRLKDRIETLEAALARIAKHDLQAIAMDALRPGERIRKDAE